jgi:hypothetical protein
MIKMSPDGALLDTWFFSYQNIDLVGLILKKTGSRFWNQFFLPSSS